MDVTAFDAYVDDLNAELFAAPDWEVEKRTLRLQREKLLSELGSARAVIAKLTAGTTGTCASPQCLEPFVAKLVPLCEAHLKRAYDLQVEIWAEKSARAPQELPEDVRTALVGEKPWVVYYIQLGDRVKIGRTTDLRKRLRSLHALPDQLLAVEPGVVIDGVDRELERHREFAHLRVPRTELFERDEHLNRHIEQVRSTFGDPSALLD